MRRFGVCLLALLSACGGSAGPTTGLAPSGVDPGVSGVSGEAGSGNSGLWADPNLDRGGFGPGGLTDTDPLLPPPGLRGF